MFTNELLLWGESRNCLYEQFKPQIDYKHLALSFSYWVTVVLDGHLNQNIISFCKLNVTQTSSEVFLQKHYLN